MWTLKSIILEKKKPCSAGFNTHLWGFQEDRWKNVHFFELNLGMWSLKSIISEKQALFCQVSTHIYGVSKEDRCKNIQFLE